MNIRGKTLVALAVLTATAIPAGATMPSLGPTPPDRTDAACWAWAREQVQDDDVAEMWGVLEDGNTDKATAAQRLFDACLGKPLPEIVGFGSSTEFNKTYCNHHHDQLICKKIEPAIEDAGTTELICAGRDTLTVLQRIIDDNLTNAINVQRKLQMDYDSSHNYSLGWYEQNSALYHQKCDNDPARQTYHKAFCDGNIAQADAQLQAAKVRAAQEAEAAKNFVPVTITPEAIITTDQTERKVSCKATLVSHGATGLASFSFTTGGGNANTAIQLPIEYTVEMTDDGKLYVTTYGLK